VTPHLAEALTRSLSCGAWPPEGRVSVYVAWSDESGAGDQKGQFLVAGYVGKEVDWPKFSNTWVEQILNSSPKIPYVHMVDIRSREWREKNGLSRDDANEKIRKAVKLIVGTDFISPYIGSMSELGWTGVKERWSKSGIKLRKHEGFPDYQCFIAYAFSVLNEIANQDAEVSRVIFNVSKKLYVPHYLHDVREEMISCFEYEQSHLAKIMGDVVPLSMEDNMPLQAADVLCWHLQRAYAGKITDEIKENHDDFQRIGLCGIEINENNLFEIEARSALRAKREQRFGTDADVFASSMARKFGFLKPEVMNVMQKEDRSLKRKKKETEFDRFDSSMRELLKVPHAELKAKLDEEKAIKKRKKSKKSSASREGV
jgi:hypothetical protein